MDCEAASVTACRPLVIGQDLVDEDAELEEELVMLLLLGAVVGMLLAVDPKGGPPPVVAGQFLQPNTRVRWTNGSPLPRQFGR